jgi:hypothetical protein
VPAVCHAAFRPGAADGRNRLSYLARAIGARWIVGFAAEQPAHKNWLLDEAMPYATEPESWTDTAARLVDGPEPALSTCDHGLLPLNMECRTLHGAACWGQLSYPLLACGTLAGLAECIRGQLVMVWSCGPGEDAA